MLIAAFNIGVFAAGLFVSLKAARLLYLYCKSKKRTAVTALVMVCLLDTLVDDTATLVFSSNTVLRTLTGEQEINAINPWAAILLRCIIFATSYAVLDAAGKARDSEEHEHATRKAIQETAEKAVGALKNGMEAT